MPTYQYRCAQCGEQFDVWQSIHDDALTVHDGACGGALLKVLGVGGIVLKGPGFYRTDSRSKAGGRETKRDRESSTAGAENSGGGGNGAGDSKSSDRSDSKSSEGSKSSTSSTSEKTASEASKREPSKS